ncbi:MAG: hypothetical protein JXA18_09510 [Chitinispirillaceae bacterium]|nr:hypothetical protein [Chitinispirillaceae bacterium]
MNGTPQPSLQKIDELDKTIRDTYFTMRISMFVIGLLFPLVLWLGGLVFLRLELQGSISAYYHTPMRNWFVGPLWALGICLIVYRGYGTTENRILNVAGVLAILVALLPTSNPSAGSVEIFTAPLLHGIVAIVFFGLIAFSCIFCSLGTLKEYNGPRWRKITYIVFYFIFAICMVVLPIFTAAILHFTGRDGHLVFWMEFSGVMVFALYWLVKTIELWKSTYNDYRSCF